MKMVVHSVWWLLLVTVLSEQAAIIPILNSSSTDETVTTEKGCSNATETRIDSEQYYSNVMKIKVRGHTRLNGSTNFTDTSWRLVCPLKNYIAVVVLRFNFTTTYALSIKHLQLTGCFSAPKSYIFMKKSILIGVNKTIPEALSHHLDIGAICLRRNTKQFAEQLLLYENIMEYLQHHPGSYEKVAHLLSHPETLVTASQDPQLQTILDLARENEEHLPESILEDFTSASGYI